MCIEQKRGVVGWLFLMQAEYVSKPRALWGLRGVCRAGVQEGKGDRRGAGDRARARVYTCACHDVCLCVRFLAGRHAHAVPSGGRDQPGHGLKE